MKRVAIFYISEEQQPGSKALFVGSSRFSTFVGFVRGELTAPGTTLSQALDMARPREGESVMNSHYVRAANR